MWQLKLMATYHMSPDLNNWLGSCHGYRLRDCGSHWIDCGADTAADLEAVGDDSYKRRGRRPINTGASVDRYQSRRVAPFDSIELDDVDWDMQRSPPKDEPHVALSVSPENDYGAAPSGRMHGCGKRLRMMSWGRQSHIGIGAFVLVCVFTILPSYIYLHRLQNLACQAR